MQKTSCELEMKVGLNNRNIAAPVLNAVVRFSDKFLIDAQMLIEKDIGRQKMC
jgi:hypothetical protein